MTDRDGMPESEALLEPDEIQEQPSQTLRFSPFYHSAVNAVAKPDKTVFCSQYFVDRWVPLLGNGVAIVLALRRLGYKNYDGGSHRDEIEIDGGYLAAKCGISEDTLIRELGIDKKTEQPRNPHLRQFVQKRTIKKRDPIGRIIQERNAYWVAMDDPIHADDWKQVADAVQAAEERVEKQQQAEDQARKASVRERKSPDTHFANSVKSPDTHFADRSPQNAEPDTHFADSDPQNANHYKTLDSILLKQTLSDACGGGDTSLSLFPEQTGQEQIAPVVSAKPCSVAIKLDMMTTPPSKFDAEWMKKKLTPERVAGEIARDSRALDAYRRNWDKIPKHIQSEIEQTVFAEGRP